MRFALPILGIVTLAIYSCLAATESNNAMLITCSVTATGLPARSYLVRILEDGVCQAKSGTRNATNAEELVEVKQNKTRTISGHDLDRLRALAKQVSELKERSESQIRKGGWEIRIMVDRKRYHYYHGDKVEPTLTELFETIRRISPLKIEMESFS
jgi:hypothetical protein